MYNRNVLSSMINRSRSIESIVIPKSLSTSDKTKLVTDFNYKLKQKWTSDDILLIFSRV
jgi:hypothetical protein